MITDIFRSILLMSVAGTALTLFLLIIKPVTKKLFSPKWQYYIWLTVLIVLVLPVSIKLPEKPPISTNLSYHTQNVETPVQEFFGGKTNEQSPVLSVVNAIETFDTYRVPINIMQMLGFIWITVVLFVLFYKISTYIMFSRRIHANSRVDIEIENIPKKLTVHRTEMLDAPLMIGLFKPILFLPEAEIKKEHLDYILMHELTHYKRCDLLYKWFAMFINSLHWFNPFVYFVSKQIDEECEISCDFSVVQKLNKQEQKGYMGMILDLLTYSKNKEILLTTQMSSGKKTLKRRFIMIRNIRKTKKITAIISAITACMIFTTTVFASGVLTNALGIYDNKDYQAFVYKGDKKMDVTDKMIIQNQEIFLPLRAVLNFYGINDIQWNNGRIQIGFPVDEEVAAYDYMQYSYANRCDFVIGENVAYLSLNEEGRGGQILSDAPFLINGITYVPQFVFESLSHYGQFLDYRFELHQPTNPKSYYEKDEEVFIGTPIEQADYVPTYENGNVKIIKRIIVNENGEVMAIITAQNQTQEVLDNIAPAYTFDLSIGGPQEFYDCFIGNANRYEENRGYHLWSNITVKNKLKSIAYIPPIYQINVHKYTGTEASDYYIQ